MLTFVLYKCFYCTVINSYLQNILIHTLTPPALSLQGKNNTSLPHSDTHTHIHTPQYGQTYAQAANSHTGGHRGALCAIEGLEDSGYLEHDRASLWVVHPLGTVQRILQHVFKRCTHKHEAHRSEIISTTSLNVKRARTFNFIFKIYICSTVAPSLRVLPLLTRLIQFK